jgi:hypothetical protein
MLTIRMEALGPSRQTVILAAVLVLGCMAPMKAYSKTINLDCNYIRDDGMPQTIQFKIDFDRKTVNDLPFTLSSNVLTARAKTKVLRIDLRRNRWSGRSVRQFGGPEESELSGDCKRTN